MKDFKFDTKFWRYLIFLILFITVLRGIRFPNVWSYSNFLFNYDYGFVKRGLIGSILSQLNIRFLFSYEFFFIFTLSIFIANIILLSSLINSLIKSKSSLSIGVSLVFVSSLSIVFLAHTVGYSDQIGLMITLITLRISGFYKKLIFLLIAMPIALLIHEAILIIFFPIIFMSLLLDIPSSERRKGALLLISFSALLVSLAFIITNGTLKEAEVIEMQKRLQLKTGIHLRQDAFNVLVRTSDDNFQLMKSLWSEETKLWRLISSLSVTGPTILFFIYLIVMILKKSKIKFYLVLFAILASLSPLLVHLWGWDMHRWNTLAVTTSFLMLMIVLLQKNDHNFITPNYIYPLIVFLIFLNGISSIPLFDGYYVKHFPFGDHLNYIIDLINGKAFFPLIPLM